MSRNILKINNLFMPIYRITSEPGDMTRYDYIMMKNYDDYLFVPYNNNFRYPQKLNIYAVKDINKQKLQKLTKDENCNIHTLKECINCMIQIEKKVCTELKNVNIDLLL